MLKRTPKLPTLKFVEHPIKPEAYTYAVAEFPNGWGVSICKRKHNEKIFPGWQDVTTHTGRTVYNKSVRYEVMRFNKTSERFDNEILTTETQLARILTQVSRLGERVVANIGACKNSAGKSTVRRAAKKKT